MKASALDYMYSTRSATSGHRVMLLFYYGPQCFQIVKAASRGANSSRCWCWLLSLRHLPRASVLPVYQYLWLPPMHKPHSIAINGPTNDLGTPSCKHKHVHRTDTGRTGQHNNSYTTDNQPRTKWNRTEEAAGIMRERNPRNTRKSTKAVTPKIR